MATDQAAALETRELSISFGGHVAVNAVSFAFHPGTLTRTIQVCLLLRSRDAV